MTDTVTPPEGTPAASTPPVTTPTTTPPAEETPAGSDPGEGARWRGYTHKELYLMLHDGPGAGASASPSRRWAEISTTLTEIGQDLQKALELTSSGWQGRAAGAAYERLATTATWANETGAGAGIMRTAVEDQGDHIAKARADMPAPEDVTPAQADPTVAPAVQVLQTQVDAEPAEAAASSAEERAVEVMVVYETNTKTTTSALASFDVPQKVLPNTDMHQGQGGGLNGILPTNSAGLAGPGPSGHHDHHHNDWRGNRDSWHSPSTGGSSSHWEDSRRPGGPSMPAPGKTMGVSGDPLLAGSRMSGGGSQERASGRGSNGGNAGSGGSGGNAGSGGSGGGNAPAAGSSSGNGAVSPKSGPSNMGLPPSELQHAAAASQAAASAHPAAGAPIAPATGPVNGGQEKIPLRRFGMDAIGSSQWFGDNDDPVVGESPRRRFDLRESAEVTEAVSILDEEHKLPPTVIGEGGR
ncbi:MAG: PPE domain-containing protein [Actinophytocola sp.]|uniref:PPE domain-containing protein n=1 Tax=Actinophytocola sp. TaxID=1872138 RepID=UPI003C78340F